MSKINLNSATDSEGEDDGHVANSVSTRPTTSLEKAHHYFLVALAGDEVKTKLMNEEILKEDVDSAMIQAYSAVVDNYMVGDCEEANRHQLSKPEGISREILMATDSRSRNRGSNSGTVTGESLWRKYQELVSYLVNYANPVWDLHISLGKSTVDCLQAVKMQLWEKVESERVDRVRASGKSCTPKSFRSTWMPKEWLAFVALGPPAGEHGKKTLCNKSKHATQLTTAAKAVVPLLEAVSSLTTSALNDSSSNGKRSSDNVDTASKRQRRDDDSSVVIDVNQLQSSDISRSLNELVKLKSFELRVMTMERLLPFLKNEKEKAELQETYETILREYLDDGKY